MMQSTMSTEDKANDVPAEDSNEEAKESTHSVDDLMPLVSITAI